MTTVRFAAIVVLLALQLATHATDAPREMHGAADTFAEPGVALGWAVLRGADEASTQVVIRIVADARVYGRVAVIGRDPFTQSTRLLLPPTASANLVDVVVPRSLFADYPRTELLFYPARAGASVAALVVYYLGVPDTTPEFIHAPKLDADLSARLARARAVGTHRP